MKMSINKANDLIIISTNGDTHLLSNKYSANYLFTSQVPQPVS